MSATLLQRTWIAADCFVVVKDTTYRFVEMSRGAIANSNGAAMSTVTFANHWSRYTLANNAKQLERNLQRKPLIILIKQ